MNLRFYFNSGLLTSEPAFLETQPGSPRGGHNYILWHGLLHPEAKKMDNNGQLTQAQGQPPSPGHLVCKGAPRFSLSGATKSP